ncbi:MAG: hypothetical protein J6Q69_00350 [Clostridia bacterium]|nr:hypothetical protein [Clostridia bacterium]
MEIIKDREIVCCLGDSITSAGGWIAEAFQHIAHTRNVKFYNCGVSGGTAALASEYLYEFCLSKNPTLVTVMFGVNDINRWLLERDPLLEDTEKRLEDAIVLYREKLEYIVKSIIEFGARVVLCTPPPYDEYNELKTKNIKCDRQLKKVEGIILELAEKYGTKIVDFRNGMFPYIMKGGIICEDRVHPSPLGYHLMGQIFLKEIGEIEKIDIESPFVPEPWNKERMTVEQTIKRLHFIDYVSLYRFRRTNGHGVPEMIDEVKRLYDAIETKEGSYFALCYENYLENKKKEPYLINELIRLTLPPKGI